MSSRMLEVRGLHAGYGAVRVLRDVDLHVAEGETVAVLGANGAGKSTLMQSLVGIVKPSAGAIRFEGRDIAGSPPEKIVRGGLTLVPEGRRVLARLTVRENLRMGAFARRDKGSTAEAIERYLEMFPILAERQNQLAGTLSGGEQQQLVICRALMGQPRLLLLDEPSLGLAPVVVEQVFELLVDLKAKEGLTVVIVEQNVSEVLEISDRAYVMEHGRLVSEGTTEEIKTAAIRLEQSYLGGEVE